MSSPISPTKHVAGRLPASTRASSSTKKYGRRIRAAILSAICAAAGVSGAHATTVSWGSLILSDFRTSDGMPLVDTFVSESFSIQLGFFANAFVPTAVNTPSWGSQWRVFDQALVNLGLNPVVDYFSSQAELRADGTSSYHLTPYEFEGSPVDFQNQTAYIWIRNNTLRDTTTEWFLATAGLAWTLPAGVDDCCPGASDVEFSVSDLYDTNSDPGITTPATPVFGSQLGVGGSGVRTVTSPLYDLQTFSFAVPEPSSLLLTLAGSCLLLIRRRPAA